jgi:hypothetical protein
MVSFTPRPLEHQRNSPFYSLDRRLDGLRSNLDNSEEREFFTHPGLSFRMSDDGQSPEMK